LGILGLPSRYLAALPLSSFGSGNYDVNVVIRRGGATTSGSAAFSVK
jgi:hypothetical protein